MQMTSGECLTPLRIFLTCDDRRLTVMGECDGHHASACDMETVSGKPSHDDGQNMISYGGFSMLY